MATKCPKCGNANIKLGEKMAYCAEYKPRKVGETWTNEGSCEFRINLANKVFNKTLVGGDIKTLIGGGTVTNKKGDKMTMDLDSEYFTKIEFAPKVEDEDL